MWQSKTLLHCACCHLHSQLCKLILLSLLIKYYNVVYFRTATEKKRNVTVVTGCHCPHFDFIHVPCVLLFKRKSAQGCIFLGGKIYGFYYFYFFNADYMQSACVIKDVEIFLMWHFSTPSWNIFCFDQIWINILDEIKWK